MFDPFCDSGGYRRHREDHGCELLIESQKELVDEGDVVRDACLRSKVLKVGDVFLEAIIHDSIGAFERLLSKLGELETSGCLGIIGEEGGFKVGSEFVEGFFRVGDGSICHFVIPHFRERDSSSPTHLVECGYDLVDV